LPFFSQNEKKSGQACVLYHVFREPNAFSMGKAIFVPLIQAGIKIPKTAAGYRRALPVTIQ
jgi:hypothetical protein